jgi:glucokinase
MTALAFGMDIGGSTVRAALIDADTGKVLRAEKVPLTERTPEHVVAASQALIDTLAKETNSQGGAVGVGFAGMLNGSVVVNAPNLGWRNVDFGGMLKQALGRSVLLMNDLSAAAWGELCAGAAKGTSDSFTVFVGTGVGSAIISGRTLLHGATGVAGEFGHIKVVGEGGRLCGCGESGCLEAYAGGARLQLWMKEVGLAGTASDLEALADAGNPEAQRLYEIAGSHLSLAIANQVTVLNPGVLVLGGGVLSRTPKLFSRIVETVGRRTGAASRRGLRIERALLGDDSGIVGAALMAAETPR